MENPIYNIHSLDEFLEANFEDMSPSSNSKSSTCDESSNDGSPDSRPDTPANTSANATPIQENVVRDNKEPSLLKQALASILPPSEEDPVSESDTKVPLEEKAKAPSASSGVPHPGLQDCKINLHFGMRRKPEMSFNLTLKSKDDRFFAFDQQATVVLPEEREDYVKKRRRKKKDGREEEPPTGYLVYPQLFTHMISSSKTPGETYVAEVIPSDQPAFELTYERDRTVCWKNGAAKVKLKENVTKKNLQNMGQVAQPVELYIKFSLFWNATFLCESSLYTIVFQASKKKRPQEAVNSNSILHSILSMAGPAPTPFDLEEPMLKRQKFTGMAMMIPPDHVMPQPQQVPNTMMPVIPQQDMHALLQMLQAQQTIPTQHQEYQMCMQQAQQLLLKAQRIQMEELYQAQQTILQGMQPAPAMMPSNPPINTFAMPSQPVTAQPQPQTQQVVNNAVSEGKEEILFHNVNLNVVNTLEQTPRAEVEQKSVAPDILNVQNVLQSSYIANTGFRQPEEPQLSVPTLPTPADQPQQITESAKPVQDTIPQPLPVAPAPEKGHDPTEVWIDSLLS